jgi:predicted Rossmann fold nucleotide-binding protein DprA/Smf involved in DNA uptake
MNSGWVKLHRKFDGWEWYDDINTKTLFIHLLIKANHKPKRWRGIDIGVGERVTSLAHLADEVGLSVMQVRTSLNKLKSTGDITSKNTNRYSLIKLNNWELYQGDNTPDNNQITRKQQTNNKQITTNKNDKKEKNDKNDKERHGEFQNVLLSKEEYNKLLEALGEQPTQMLIAELSSYIASSGKRYKSHYATLQGWARRKIRDYAVNQTPKRKIL